MNSGEHHEHTWGVHCPFWLKFDKIWFTPFAPGTCCCICFEPQTLQLPIEEQIEEGNHHERNDQWPAGSAAGSDPATQLPSDVFSCLEISSWGSFVWKIDMPHLGFWLFKDSTSLGKCCIWILRTIPELQLKKCVVGILEFDVWILWTYESRQFCEAFRWAKWTGFGILSGDELGHLLFPGNQISTWGSSDGSQLSAFSAKASKQSYRTIGNHQRLHDFYIYIPYNKTRRRVTSFNTKGCRIGFSVPFWYCVHRPAAVSFWLSDA